MEEDFASVKKVRIAVLGNSDTGKTALVSLLCGSGGGVKSKLGDSKFKFGCNVDVMLFKYFMRASSVPSNLGGVDPLFEYIFVEFFDISGNENFTSCHHLYLQDIDGIILMHDLTNQKSTDRLNFWLNRVVDFVSIPSSKIALSTRTDNDFYVATRTVCPLLIVGSKQDLNPNWIDRHRVIEKIQTQYMCNSIKINCRENISHQFSCSATGLIFDKFFNDIINIKYYSAKPLPTAALHSTNPYTNYRNQPNY